MVAREYGIGATAETTQAHLEDSMPSASTGIWLGGGMTSIVAGALLVAGHLFDYGSRIGTGAVIG